jgi:GNAT superfamily N-acetyltransferase
LLQIEVAQLVEGYLISWPKIDVYFIDNIAVNPAHQGLGLGRMSRLLAVLRPLLIPKNFGIPHIPRKYRYAARTSSGSHSL